MQIKKQKSYRKVNFSNAKCKITKASPQFETKPVKNILLYLLPIEYIKSFIF